MNATSPVLLSCGTGTFTIYIFNHGSWDRIMKTFLLGLVCLKTCKEVPIRLLNSKLEDFLLEQGAEHIDCVFDKVAAVYVRR